MEKTIYKQKKVKFIKQKYTMSTQATLTKLQTGSSFQRIIPRQKTKNSNMTKGCICRSRAC